MAEYADHRRVIEHNDIDAVIVVTPEHWHAPITIDACRAGKDGCCEKPLVQNPEDGQAVVRARHREFLHLPFDYPRISQFPEWFAVAPDRQYAVSSPGGAQPRHVSGAELLQWPVQIPGGGELRLTVKPLSEPQGLR